MYIISKMMDIIVTCFIVIIVNCRVFSDLLKELSLTVAPNHHLLKIQKVLIATKTTIQIKIKLNHYFVGLSFNLSLARGPKGTAINVSI